MRKRKHWLELNNKGASLITVIITIGFIAILAGTVMMTSLVNFKMKRVNVYAKDTFYSAEQVLDEINIGLQRYISDSLSVAYMDVMQNYSQYSVEKKRNVMQTKYYEKMWEKLEVGASAHQKYDVAVLEGFLKDTTKWQGNDTTGYGGIVRAYETDVHGNQNLSMQGDMITYDTGIVLKDLRVYYKDSKGFVSVIETDIRLTYPELDFAATTALPDIASHVIIADEGMVVEGSSADELALEGNFYADSVVCEGTSAVGSKSIVHSGDGRVVIKHDLDLKNASFSNEEEGSLWVEDIEIKGANVTLLGETFVADDLNVNGDGSMITLGGIYNGFGNSLQNPDKSSAILVNGSNSTLDLSGIEKITLAGHAYVGTKREVAEGALQASENVYTGESIAVKSNQLMYLIPPECIGVDSVTGESLYHKNPMTSAEYNAVMAKIAAEPARYTEVSLDVEVQKLGSTLTGYIATDVNGKAVPEKVFVPTNGEPLIYYYMKFNNEESANRYFAMYYNSNKATFDEYMENYIHVLDFPSTATVTRVKMAANGVYGKAQDGYTLIPNTVEGTASEIADNQLRYQQKYTALCTKLSDNFLELGQVYDDVDSPEKIVFDNLVDEDKLKAYIQAGGGTDYLEKKEDFGTLILTTRDDFSVGDSDIHLVISTGDVMVNCDFEGTIFANGTITVSNSVHSLKTNSDAVSAMLRYYQPMNGQNVMVAQVLRAGEDFVFALEDAESNEDATYSLADLIVYENWKKE